MKKFSKASLASVALAVILSSCNTGVGFTEQPVTPIVNEQINPQEVSSFAAAATVQIASEQDTNKDNLISRAEAGITSSEMLQIDLDKDGIISKNEITKNIETDFFNAAKITQAINASAIDAPVTATGLPNRLPLSTFKGNKVQLFIDREEIIPMMMETIRGAQKSIQMDIYLLGGKIGLQVAQELVKKAQEGIDVKITMDPSLGFAGPTQKEVYQVAEYLKQNKIDFKLYPLHLMPKLQDGALKNKFQIDHNKLYVIDEKIFITGGFNLFDIGVINRDLMLKIEGPTAAEASEMLDYEWSLGDQYISPKPPKNLFVVKDIAGDSMVKIVKTAPFESSTKPAMIATIDNAKKNVYLAVLEFSDLDLTKALIRAYKRGVDVRIMMDRKDTNDKYAGGIPVPTYFPNILPARELVKNNVPTRWYDARLKGQELHMKMIVVDGQELITGSTNFTRQAFTTFRETSVHISGGTAPVKMESTFREDWLNHSTAIKKFTLKDKIKAKVVEFLDNKYYSWW